MTTIEKQNIIEKLKLITPGKTYPDSVTIIEKAEGVFINKQEKERTVKFCLQSYLTGMYQAVYFPHNTIPMQGMDHNNITLVRKLKKDIKKALERGVVSITIGVILPVKTFKSLDL